MRARRRHGSAAASLAGEAVELFRAEGDPYGAAWSLAEQGWYAMVHGRLDEAERHLSEALDLDGGTATTGGSSSR